MPDREDTIRARAYALWIASGRPESAAMDFWREAERQIDQERSARAGKGQWPGPPGAEGRGGNLQKGS